MQRAMMLPSATVGTVPDLRFYSTNLWVVPDVRDVSRGSCVEPAFRSARFLCFGATYIALHKTGTAASGSG